MIRASGDIDIARVKCLIIDESVTSLLLLSFFFKSIEQEDAINDRPG